ncbi:MAG: efflux RND transporter periplasmic adaptor subunit, partial [Nevskiaceae bacterium]
MIGVGTPVVVIGDPSRVDVVAEFLSQDAVSIKPGARAFIENWGVQGAGTSPVEAIVERVEPVARTKVSALGIEEQRTKVILQFVATPPEPLRAHDFRVDVRIVIEEAQDALRVPLGALVRDGEGWAVFVVERGSVEKRMLAVGLKDDRYRVVVGNLRAGEMVVAFPPGGAENGTTSHSVVSDGISGLQLLQKRNKINPERINVRLRLRCVFQTGRFRFINGEFPSAFNPLKLYWCQMYWCQMQNSDLRKGSRQIRLLVRSLLLVAGAAALTATPGFSQNNSAGADELQT